MSEAVEVPSLEVGVNSVMEALDLTKFGATEFRATPFSKIDERGAYGGLLIGQALRAASLTVPEDRVAHSLHGYFLRPAFAHVATEYAVEVERDGRQFSARRVVGRQNDRVVFTMSTSFQAPYDGPEFQQPIPPQTPSPLTLETWSLGSRMLDVEARVPHDPEQFHRWPTRLWVRLGQGIEDDPNLQASALAFISDLCTGLSKAPSVDQVGILPSIDHALWIHRPVDLNGWVLMELLPESTNNGRGTYTGRIFNPDGSLAASLTQESLFRVRPESQRVKS